MKPCSTHTRKRSKSRMTSVNTSVGIIPVCPKSFTFKHLIECLAYKNRMYTYRQPENTKITKIKQQNLVKQLLTGAEKKA